MLEPVMILHPELEEMPGDYIDNLLALMEQRRREEEALLKNLGRSRTVSAAASSSSEGDRSTERITRDPFPRYDDEAER